MKKKLNMSSPSCLSLTRNVEITLAIIAFLGAIVGATCIFSDASWVGAIQFTFSFLFLIDVFVRIAGGGLEDYLLGEWNLLDLFLIVLSLIFSFVTGSHALSGLLKIVRLFRVYPFLKSAFE